MHRYLASSPLSRRSLAAALALVVGFTLCTPALQASHDDPAVTRAVAALLRGEKDAVEEAWRLPPHQIDLVATRLVERWKRDPHGIALQRGGDVQELAVGGPLFALRALTQDRPPLPGGAPKILVDEVSRLVLQPPDAHASRWVIGDYHEQMELLGRSLIMADGPGRMEERLSTLAPLPALVYAGSMFPAARMAMKEGVQGWTEADAMKVLDQVTDEVIWFLSEPDAAQVLRSLPEVETIASVIMVVAMKSDVPEEQRFAAARCFAEIADAYSTLAAREAGIPPRRFEGAVVVSLAVLSGYEWEDGMNVLPEPKSVEASIHRLAEFDGERLSERTLGAIVTLLDSASRQLGVFAAKRERYAARKIGAEKEPGVDGVCDALAALVLRIHAIPPSHAAWSEENRCLWIEAVDRDRGGEHEAKCASIAAAWATARAGIDAEWREACTKRAEVDAAERETRRAARQERREAWEARLREGAEKPKDS